jgi:hypothetical protein
MAWNLFPKHGVIRTVRPPFAPEIARRKKRYAWRADGGRQMLHSGVIANEQLASPEHLAGFPDGGFPRQTDRAVDLPRNLPTQCRIRDPA